MYEDAKETLVSVPPEGFPAAQAKAQMLEHLRDQLSRPSFAESQAPFKQPIQE